MYVYITLNTVMKSYIKQILIIVVVLIGPICSGQKFDQGSLFTIRGYIYDSQLQKPVSNANIEVNGGAYTTTNKAGEFRIQAKIGDELVIKHKDFETVYYIIKNQERIRVEVRPSNETYVSKTRRNEPGITFNSFIDSAIVYKKINLEKSMQFGTEA